MPGMPHRAFPCNECPWRRDVTPGQFPAEHYEALRNTSGAPGAEACMTAPLFACHKGEPGTNADLACAGWLAVVGFEHLRIRFALIRGELEPSALGPGENWPPLFESYDEMASTQGAPRFQPEGS